jgi:predicted  nucleic acid-binding Zn-ribbon protein
VDWQALDMELEEQMRDFERRVEEGRGEVLARIEGVERSCKEVGEERRREWEELKGRVMTAEEKRQHDSDEFLRLMATMTDEYVSIFSSLRVDMQREFAEGRAENRAQTEALLRMLDRLPPSESER